MGRKTTVIAFTLGDEDIKVIDGVAEKMKVKRSAALRSILNFWNKNYKLEVTLTPQAVNPGNDREITASGS